jgi:hypothetical protein
VNPFALYIYRLAAIAALFACVAVMCGISFLVGRLRR